MIILGLDPGLATTGYGVVEISARAITHKEHGTLKTSPNLQYRDRLISLNKQLKAVVKKFAPDCVGIEKLYVHKNVKTATMVGEARGVLMLTIARFPILMYEFTPLQVKQILTGYGRATKTQVQNMVMRMLKLKEPPKPDDAADALAVAICVAQTYPPCGKAKP